MVLTAKTRLRPVLVISVLLVIISTAVLAACPAEMVSYWQFNDTQLDDDFSGASIDTSKWVLLPYDNIITHQNNEVRLQLNPGTGTRSLDLASPVQITGDFDVQVDFNDFTEGSFINAGGPVLILYTNNDDFIYLRAESISNKYQMYSVVDNSWTRIDNNGHAFSTTSGKLRITRSGTTMTAYYWSGSSWTSLGSSSNAAFNQGMQARMHFVADNPSGTNYVDYDNFIVNNGEIARDCKSLNNGTIIGAAWASGKIGNGLQLDGVGDAFFLPYPVAASTDLYTGSVFAWIKTSNAGSSYRGIVVKAGAYGMFLVDNSLALYDWSAGGGLRNSNVILNDNKWHLVGFTFQNGVSSGTKLYVDGVSVLTTTLTIDNQATALAIGMGTNPTINGQDFTGAIDEVAIYNTALTAVDVAELYSGSNRSLSYCALEPVATGYDAGSTNLSVVADLTNVSGLTLVKTGSGTIKWTAPVDVVGADLSSQVRIGTGFVSINKSSLHSSLDGPANVSITVAGCNDYTVYYATGYQSSLASLKSVGQVCNAGTTPACTNIKCEGTTLSFTVSHFDGYGGEGSAGQPVPEFGTWALMIALGLTIGGFVAIRRK
jgi:hypothetical protein